MQRPGLSRHELEFCSMRRADDLQLDEVSSCVDGPRLARDLLACCAEVDCSHVSGLLMQPGWTAGPDGVREPRPHHVWMAPAWQENFWRAAQRSLAVMCP